MLVMYHQNAHAYLTREILAPNGAARMARVLSEVRANCLVRAFTGASICVSIGLTSGHTRMSGLRGMSQMSSTFCAPVCTLGKVTPSLAAVPDLVMVAAKFVVVPGLPWLLIAAV